MAESETTVVSVLEGPYTILNKFGVPLPVCFCMQGNELQLRNAQWTAKQSHSGFSVSFFWPTLKSEFEANVTVSKKNRKRKKREAGAKAQKVTQEAAVKVASDHLGDSTETGTSTNPVITAPITTHQRKPSSKKQKEVKSLGQNFESTTLTSPEPLDLAHHHVNTPATSNYDSEEPAHVDLTSCDGVAYEYRDNVPGLNYTVNGREEWTPVKKARKKRIKQPVSSTNDAITSDSDSSQSSSSLDVSCSRLVEYSVQEGVPGLTIYRKNIHWTPIVPSPISSRTRSKMKKT